MADEYKLQISTNINGDLVNLRSQSGDELKEIVEGFATNSPAIFRALGDVKQAGLANGVFTGNASDVQMPSGGGGAKPSAASTPPGTVPSCPTHGAMKDMKGKLTKAGDPMRNRFYCSKFGCKDVEPQGEWIA